MCDGKIDHAGLTDRLRGMVSGYQTCKELNIKFYIHFVHPFSLELFLQPNIYNWKIEQSNISFNSKDAVPFICYDPVIIYKHKKLVRKINKIDSKQIHYYSNDHYSLYKSFSVLFNELFKPTDILQQAVDKHYKAIDEKYIGLAFRFQNLMGDFNECYNHTALDHEQQIELLNRCIAEIHRIKQQYPEHNKFLVTSDSSTFINEADKIPFVYTLQGTRIHSGNTQDNSIETHLTTFVDLFLLSKADKIICVSTSEMYQGGFSLLASKIGNVPFERYKF
jgi:hypothetical protein